MYTQALYQSMKVYLVTAKEFYFKNLPYMAYYKLRMSFLYLSWRSQEQNIKSL